MVPNAPKKIRGRGIDYALRFATSRWAEDLLLEAIAREGFIIARLGLSAVGEKSVIEIYEPGIKVPDLLVFDPAILSEEEMGLISGTDLSQLAPEVLESPRYSKIFEKACAAIEVEFSPYQASEMKGRNWATRPEAKLLARPPKHANPPSAPNVFIKEEDLGRLRKWEERFGVHIIVTHVFDQEAFAIRLDRLYAFDEALRSTDETGGKILQLTQGIFKKIQIYDRSDAQGAREHKVVFCITPATSVFAGIVSGVKVEAQL